MRLQDVDARFEDFVVARGPALVRFAHGLSGDRHLAEDLVQEVLAKAASRWSRLDHPEAYLRRSLCRELVSWRRRRSHGERPGDVPDRPGPGDLDHAVVERDAVWRMLATLQPRQRAVLVLRYWEGLSDREIAQHLDCSQGTVRSSAARAFTVLRAEPDLAHLLSEGVRP